jgi:CRP-like cAMP-binding protein
METGNMVMVHPEQFDPYPGEFLKEDLQDKIYRGCMMLAIQYLAEGNTDACREALRNIYIAKYEAPPKFNAFLSYRETQKHWDGIIQLVRKKRYDLRATLERHNLSSSEVIRDEAHIRRTTPSEILRELRKISLLKTLTEDEILKLSLVCRVKTYYAKETIFSAGDYNGAVHIVLKGKIRLSVHNDNDSEIAPLDVAFLEKGDPLGENCLFYDTFKLNGTAEEFTELLYIRTTDFNNLLQEHPALGVKLLKLLLSGAAAKMDRANEKLKQSALYNCNVVDPSAVD